MISSAFRFVLAACLWLLLPTSVRGSPNPVALDPYENHIITVEHIALPNFGRVRAIIRDERGFLWFGTNRGLCKYDGQEVRVFMGPTPTEKYITAIVKTRDGSLLLATWDGLWTFNLTTEQFSPLLIDVDSPERMVIDALALDSLGKIWIGTRSKGLIEYEPTTRALRRYTTRDGLGNNMITQLLVDHEGVLWVGTYRGGLNSLNPKTKQITHYRNNPQDPGTLSDNTITSLQQHGTDELWVGTTYGLNLLDRKSGRVRRFSMPSLLQLNVAAITLDPSGTVWIGTSANGIFTYHKGRVREFETSSKGVRGSGNANTLSDNHIQALYVDPVATSDARVLLWVGTRSGGVNKVLITRNPFLSATRLRDSPLRGHGAILSLYEDRTGVLWVGLWGGGLNALKRTRNGTYRHRAHYLHDPQDPFSLPEGDTPSRIIEDHEGVLWVGTTSGLAALDGVRKRFITYKHIENDSTSLAGNIITELYEDRSGRMWIGTSSGLTRLIRGAGGKKEKYQFKNYSYRSVDADTGEGIGTNDIKEDRSGNIWVGTGRGLIMLNPGGEFIRFRDTTYSLDDKANWVYDLVEDDEGTFWLSTAEGLISFDPKSVTFTRHRLDHLQEAHISDIFVGEQGNLWLSTAIGLIRFHPKTRTFVRHDETHGFPFRELISEFYQNRQGKLFVGTLDGFTEFYPDSVHNPTTPPTIALTGFSIFDETMPAAAFAGPEIVLAHDQNFFSFTFAALDYTRPKGNRYAYRMVGVDVDWIQAGTRNYVSYTNLDPGEYVFQVKGANSDDVWNEAATSLRVAITPPYWQTWWFRMLAVAVLSGALYAAYRYRLTKAIEVERLRLRIAHDLHDDVGSNLSAIAMASRSVQRSSKLPGPTKRKLAEIYDTAVLTQEGMKDLVWFIKPQNDTLNDLFVRMRETATSLLGKADVEFEASPVPVGMKVAVDFKRSIFLAFKEALTNIVKHASASRVEIRIGVEDNNLEMLIRDNGRGFDTGANHRGTGLQSLQRRAQTIGGGCEISSRPGHGTTVKFSGQI